MNEEEYKKELAANGVDIPEVKEESEQEPTKEPEKEPEKAPEPEEPRKPRSIYDDLKEKKQDLKAEREAREQAEAERDEIKTKYEALQNAKTPEDRKDAQDEIDQFMDSHSEWNKEAVTDLVEIARKGFKTQGLSDEDRKTIEEAKALTSENKKLVAEQQFSTELEQSALALKELFPNASTEEMDTIKKELKVLAHSTEWHDKELDYIVFKNKSTLEKFVSPKKRGLESRENKDTVETTTSFDPNADYSKMTMKEREVWEEGYKKLTASDGLVEDSQGRKILI
jgi:hypothetical protein